MNMNRFCDTTLNTLLMVLLVDFQWRFDHCCCYRLHVAAFNVSMRTTLLLGQRKKCHWSLLTLTLCGLSAQKQSVKWRKCGRIWISRLRDHARNVGQRSKMTASVTTSVVKTVNLMMKISMENVAASVIVVIADMTQWQRGKLFCIVVVWRSTCSGWQLINFLASSAARRKHPCNQSCGRGACPKRTVPLSLVWTKFWPLFHYINVHAWPKRTAWTLIKRRRKKKMNFDCKEYYTRG